MISPGPNSIDCPRCRTTISWPADLDDARKADLATFARNKPVSVVKWLRDDQGLPLSEAKAIVSHISRSDDVCVRCRSTVARGETVCSNCKSANLNW